MDELSETMAVAEPTAALEMAFIKEYLGSHLPTRAPTREQVEQTWKDALLFAALKLEEVAAKAHLVDRLHERPRCM
jgi:hypothetical protein